MKELGIPKYGAMLEMLEELVELHVGNGATNAEFLDVVEEMGFSPRSNRISVEVGKNEEAEARFKTRYGKSCLLSSNQRMWTP
jgi:hypothetical protein